MHVKAYICDYNNHIVHEDEITGINPVEDFFDRQLSYPITNKPEKANIHFCTQCYNENVLIPAQNTTNRKKDEELYKLRLKELAFAFRSTTVANYNKKTSAKKNSGRKKG